MGNSSATFANPDGCGSHARRRSARKVLNLNIGRPLDRVLALEVLNPGPEGAVAAHLFQKKRAAGGPNLIAQVAYPVGCIGRERLPTPDSPPTISQSSSPSQGERSIASSIGSTLRKRAAAGIATKCGIRRVASIWVSVVVPGQTFAQPSPQSAGSIPAMFCGRFARQNQSRAGVRG